MSVPDVRARQDEVHPTGEWDHWWVVRMWTLVAVFAALAVAGSRHYGIPFRDPGGAWVLRRVAISLVIFAVLVLVDAVVRAAGPGWTARRTLQVLRDRWTRPRLVLALTGLAAYYSVYLCYKNLKSWNVFNEPRDDLLQRWDRWLFLGHDPAALMHDVLGQHVAAYVLSLIYVSFSSVVTVAVVAALVLNDRVRQGYVFIASAMWVWILGVGAYYLIPSLGPFSYAPEQFAGLSRTWIQDTQARYLTQRDYLLAEPQAHDATAQIAAFASLHTAVVLMLLLMARYYRLTRVVRLMNLYLAGTLAATIYLGWHYAVDLAGGVAIAYAAVFLGQWMVDPQGVHRRPAPGA